MPGQQAEPAHLLVRREWKLAGGTRQLGSRGREEESQGEEGAHSFSAVARAETL